MKRPPLAGKAICPKCGLTMRRVVRPNSVVKPGQQFYFKEWDLCSCGHLQHYEAFKQRVEEDGLFNESEFQPIRKRSIQEGVAVPGAIQPDN